VRLARKAGTIVVGVALTKDSVRAGRVRAVWIADDLLAKRSQSLIDGWRATGVAIYRGWTKDELGDLAGKAAVAVLSRHSCGSVVRMSVASRWLEWLLMNITGARMPSR